jgi:urea carboxylase
MRMQRDQDEAIAALDRPAFAALPAEQAGKPTWAHRCCATWPPKAINPTWSAPVRRRQPAVRMGPLVLDLELRFRVQALMEAVKAAELPGILDLTPGIRSLQVHFDPRRWTRTACWTRMVALEEGLPPSTTWRCPIPHRCTCPCPGTTRRPSSPSRNTCSRCARTPPGAPATSSSSAASTAWPPSTDVYKVVFEASYLVMGLGDVYLGAPVATPLDPRHRLVTTKYNPARTWTPENAVGIGGAYLCVYGMEGPGGYQFVGRTVQMWNRHRVTADFEKPWLLRFFDQIRFHPGGRGRLLQDAQGLRRRPLPAAGRAHPFPPAPTTAASWPTTPNPSPPSRPASRPPSRPSANAGRPPART